MIALIIITLLFIVALILVKKFDDEFFEPTCVFFALFVVFGWFFYGLFYPSNIEMIYLSPSDVTIAKGDGVVIYVYNNKTIKSSNYHVVNSPEKYISNLYLYRQKNIFSITLADDVLKFKTDE